MDDLKIHAIKGLNKMLDDRLGDSLRPKKEKDDGGLQLQQENETQQMQGQEEKAEEISQAEQAELARVYEKMGA